MIFAGPLVGNLSGGFVADAFGRRAALLSMACLFCIAGTFSAFAPDILSFCIARFITGIGVGAIIPVADSHLLEWSPAPWRARLAMALVGAAFAVGSLIACGVGIAVHELLGADSEWWRVMLMICIIPGLMSLPAIFFLLPESMHWLLVRGRHDEVKELLKQLNSLNSTELLSDGNVTQFTPVEQGGGDDADQPLMNWRFLEAFGSELLGTTAYLTVVFTACGYIYYGHIFIYPRLLEMIYDLKLKEAYTAVMVSSLAEMCVVLTMMFYMDLENIGRRGAMITGFSLVCVASLLVMADKQVYSPVNISRTIFACIHTYTQSHYTHTRNLAIPLWVRVHTHMRVSRVCIHEFLQNSYVMSRTSAHLTQILP